MMIVENQSSSETLHATVKNMKTAKNSLQVRLIGLHGKELNSLDFLHWIFAMEN